MMFVLTVPSSFGLIILGRPIIGAIFQGGRFELYDTQQTATALSLYSIGLLGYAATKILNPAFYALSDAQTPMYISMVSVSSILRPRLRLTSYLHMGYAALALSTSVVAIVGLFMPVRTAEAEIGRNRRAIFDASLCPGCRGVRRYGDPAGVAEPANEPSIRGKPVGLYRRSGGLPSLWIGALHDRRADLRSERIRHCGDSPFVRPFKDRLAPARAKIRN